MIVVANWRLDNGNSPVAMLQEKTARKAFFSHVVRTYIPKVRGVLIFLFRVTATAVCTKEKAQHGTAAAPQKQ